MAPAVHLLITASHRQSRWRKMALWNVPCFLGETASRANIRIFWRRMRKGLPLGCLACLGPFLHGRSWAVSRG